MQHLSYSACFLCACAVLVGTVTSLPVDHGDDECTQELCWSAVVLSDRCAAACQLWAGETWINLDEPRQLLPYVKRRQSSFVRIGKSDVGAADTGDQMKRYSSFVRIGRPAEPSKKRYSSFVRIGRAGAPSDGDRQAVHDSTDDSTPFNKRRTSSFVKIG